MFSYRSILVLHFPFDLKYSIFLTPFEISSQLIYPCLNSSPLSSLVLLFLLSSYLNPFADKKLIFLVLKGSVFTNQSLLHSLTLESNFNDFRNEV